MVRLNANYPGQQVEPLTAAEWFGPLQGFPAAEVWDAIDRHRRDLTPDRDGRPAGHWAPSLAGILACVDANWRERSAARRELEARQRRERNGKGGVPAPPEFTEARKLLERTKLMPDHPDRLEVATARARIEALADQLDLAEVGRLT